MAGQRTSFRHGKSLAGAALVGLGIFILYHNLAGIVMQLRHVFASSESEALGEPLAAILAVLQAYALDHQQFLQRLFQQMWVSSWPLLLVMVGTLLSRNNSTDNINAPSKKDDGPVDLSAGRSTLKWRWATK